MHFLWWWFLSGRGCYCASYTKTYYTHSLGIKRALRNTSFRFHVTWTVSINSSHLRKGQVGFPCVIRASRILRIFLWINQIAAVDPLYQICSITSTLAVNLLLIRINESESVGFDILEEPRFYFYTTQIQVLRQKI